MKLEQPEQLEHLDFDKGEGLIAVIAQHVDTGEVRMLGFADRAALTKTLSTRDLHFFSRRRQALWKKGETSGNTLALVSLHADCDADAVLALVKPAGPTCHRGSASCFQAAPFAQRLAEIIDERLTATGRGDSYTGKLFEDRNLRLKKIAEEAGELAVACADEDTAAVTEEAADLLYHTMVACRAVGVRFEDIVEVLRKRHA